MKDMNTDRDLYSTELKDMLRESIAKTIDGAFSPHKDNPIFTTREAYPMQTKIDQLPLYPQDLPKVILTWANLDPLKSRNKEDILVLDLETTGLGRGGTLAFMIGLGYYEREEFIVEQIFLPDPDAEEHSFDRLREIIERKSILITFNGKTFDVPVLESRLLYHQIWLNLREMEHIDLLHIARRLWRRKLPSCALETIEFYILGHIRDKELDIEGGDIPQTYFHYLMTGEADLIRRIFVHNHHDILHTAALFTLICDSAGYPPQGGMDARIDYHALARLYLSQSQPDMAKSILLDLLAQGVLSPEIVYDLGLLYKKEADSEGAMQCFGIGKDLQHPPSMVEYAKLLEKAKDFHQALSVSESVLAIEKGRYLINAKSVADTEKRILRLSAKLARLSSVPK